MFKKGLFKMSILSFTLLLFSNTLFARGIIESAPKDSKSDIFKVGAIYIGNEGQGYTAAHMKGISEMKETLGLSDLQVIEKTNIPESEACYIAVDQLASHGCDLIFAISFGYEEYILQAAEIFPDVQFCQATGNKAEKSGLKNMHNYMPAVYQSRYVSGVAAGLKLNEMIAEGIISEDSCNVGYIGAFQYAEVISGFTSFFLGIRSVCPSANMMVRYTYSWGNEKLEKEIAQRFIDDGCVLISQHSDTTGGSIVCEENKIPIIGYNIDMASVAPNAAITSAAINWAPYYILATKNTMEGRPTPVDWSKGYVENAVYITPINKKVAAKNTQEKIDSVIEAIKSDEIHVFDTNNFTIGGKSLEELIAEGGEYAKYSDFVNDNYFHEQKFFSAPSFDLIIDGIKELID